MLNKDYSGAIQNAVRNSLSLDFSPIPNKLEQLPEVLSTGLDDWDKTMRKQAYENALKGGNQEEIDKALAEYNPEAYANVMTAREQRQQALEDAQVERDFKKELLDLQTQRALQLEGIRQGNAMKLAEFKAGLDGNTTAQKNISYLQSLGYSPEEAAALYYGGNNPTLNMDMLGKKGQEAADKKIGEYVADEQIAQQQMKTLKPKAENALKRAEESLADGTGLGQLGGWGWTTGKGGQNRANIKNAQAQINTTMRGLLKQMGVGSTELNSAAEAEAYRYMLSPDMPIGQIQQVIDNFKQDYLSGELQRDLAETYAKPSLKSFNQVDTSDPRVQEALNNGYSLEEIQAYLRK
jgi:hypothetical protein